MLSSFNLFSTSVAQVLNGHMAPMVGLKLGNLRGTYVQPETNMYSKIWNTLCCLQLIVRYNLSFATTKGILIANIAYN